MKICIFSFWYYYLILNINHISDKKIDCMCLPSVYMILPVFYIALIICFYCLYVSMFFQKWRNKSVKSNQSYCGIRELGLWVSDVHDNTHNIWWAWSWTYLGCIKILASNVLIRNSHARYISNVQFNTSDIKFNCQLNIKWPPCTRKLLLNDELRVQALWQTCLNCQEDRSWLYGFCLRIIEHSPD